MKLHFEMEFNLDELPENLPNAWVLSFTLDYDDNEITFDTVSGDHDVPGDRYDDVDWLDFLQLVERENDGDFVNSLMTMAHAHVDLNAEEALRDYYSRD